MTKNSRFLHYRYFWLLASCILISDQATKYWILHNVPEGTYHDPSLVLIPEVLNIVHIYNPGAAWGMFSGYGTWLALLGLVALTVIFFMRKSLGITDSPQLQVVFGMLSGGILGNVIDRFAYGHVIDFIDVHLPFSVPYVLEGGRWPAFNIADSGITVGVVLYLFMSFKADIEKSPASLEKSNSENNAR